MSLPLTANEADAFMVPIKPFKRVIGTVEFLNGCSYDCVDVEFKNYGDGTMLVSTWFLGTKIHEIVDQGDFDYFGYCKDFALRQFDLSLIRNVTVREGDV